MQSEGWIQCQHCGGTGTCERGDTFKLIGLSSHSEPDKYVRKSCARCLEHAGVTHPSQWAAQVPCSICGGVGKYWLVPPSPGQLHPLAYKVVSADLTPLKELADSVKAVLAALQAIEERQTDLMAKVVELVQAGAPILVEPQSGATSAKAD
jgi:hypothetical protein